VRSFVAIALVMLSARIVAAQPGTLSPEEAEAATQPPTEATPEPGWGTYEPGFGKGLTIGNTSLGELSLSGYTLFRFIDQTGNDTFIDHLGNEQSVNRRLDITLHRLLVYFNGWVYDPKFRYNTTLWTVLSTQQVNIIGSLSYLFHPAFQLSVGLNGLPGTRSLQNVFPFFLGTDRQLADDFFRPGFTSGIWISGTLLPGLDYIAMLGNGLSQVGIKASQLTRTLASAASIAWKPTTGEFGTRGGFGDYEEHDELATRFGVSFTHSRENAQDQLANPSPDNTSIKLSDSVNAFQVGALAPDVQVETATFWLLAADAGFKIRGLHVQGEYYFRTLDRFDATGPLPVSTIVDTGFYVQASYFVVPRRLMLYGVTSVIFGAFGITPWEAGGGADVYPFHTRNMRLNVFATHVDRSPVSSLFGYYVGGETGMIYSASADLLF
jgi:hypothetical protein